MWAITSYYNPVGYKRRLTNYKTFRANLGVPLVTVELSFDGRFELTDGDADILIQLSGGAVLWQKERLLNVATKSVPQDVRNIAWLDCDVIFERSDWMHEADQKLYEAIVVQLYSDLIDLGPEEQPNGKLREMPPSGHGIVSLGFKRQNAPTDNDVRASLPGLAWATRRDVLEQHGFYDAMIIGSADTSMFHAMHGQLAYEVERRLFNENREKHYLMWARSFHKTIAGNVDYVPGRIYHLHHGKFINRKYRTRDNLMANFAFDPNLDLRIGENGAWQWARPRPDLEELLKTFFVDRAEDE